MSEPARHQRSSGGLLGALIVTVLAVLAIVGFRAVFSEETTTPVREVDWAAQVRVAREADELAVVAPARLPLGWTATSATCTPGGRATWHLGLLTDDGKYVGVEESTASVEDLVEEHVDADAERGQDVTIDGRTWQSWTDAGGDYAVARSARVAAGGREAWLVVGTAPEAEIRELAGSLRTR
jgi:hypothetical protein